MIGRSFNQLLKLITKTVVFCFISTCTFIFVATATIETSFSEELLNGQGLLWRVEAEGKSPSYIYGTLNSSERSVVAAGSYARELLQESDYLLVDVLDDDSIKQKLFSVMLYTDNRRLSDLVFPVTFDNIKVLGYEYGYLARQMNVLKPWAARVIFSSPPSEASRISLGIRTLNQTFQDLAKEKNIEIIQMETIEEQLSVVEHTSEADQLALLSTLPDEIQSVEQKYQVRIDNFLKQSSQALYLEVANDIAILSPEAQANYLNSFVFKRNHQMALRMSGPFMKGKSLAVLDAIHLPGEQGVLSLLQAQGFKVTAIK